MEPLGGLLAAEACRPHSLQKSQTFRSKPRVCGVPDFQTSNVLGIRFDQFAKASVDARSCAKRTFWGNARFVRFGRFDPFVKPSANGGYLRTARKIRSFESGAPNTFGQCRRLRWVGARLAPADGPRVGRRRLHFRKRQFSRFTAGLRSKVREGHSDESNALRRWEHGTDQVEGDFM